jgi:hypothetical protein
VLATGPRLPRPGGGVMSGKGDNDATILRLFRQWISDNRSLTHIPKTLECEAQFNAAILAIAQLEHSIADTPACGLAGFAVKAYLACYHEHQPDRGDDPAGVSLLTKGYVVGEDEDLDAYANFHCIAAVIRDAAQVVPEIADLGRLVIEPPLDRRAAEAERVRFSILEKSMATHRAGPTIN